jgi:Fur family transcriptional regulator, peroxide stress response regulator
VINQYKSLNLKLTPQRLAVLEYLEGNTGHPSAQEIYAAVSEKFPTMSFATVYNTLRALKKGDRVTELSIDAGRKRFDPNTEAHHHLICVECRKIVDVFREFDLDLPQGEKQGFEISTNHVDFYGVCPECGSGGEKVKAEAGDSGTTSTERNEI